MPARVCKSYKVLVGMEIHVQLATQSKMFTGAANGGMTPVWKPPYTLIGVFTPWLFANTPVRERLASLSTTTGSPTADATFSRNGVSRSGRCDADRTSSPVSSTRPATPRSCSPPGVSPRHADGMQRGGHKGPPLSRSTAPARSAPVPRSR